MKVPIGKICSSNDGDIIVKMNVIFNPTIV